MSLRSPGTRGVDVQHTCTISFECHKTQVNSNSSHSELWHSVAFKIDAAELVCSVWGIIITTANHIAANVHVDYNYKLLNIDFIYIYVGHQQVYYLILLVHHQIYITLYFQFEITLRLLILT